jgi:hypothetical protein
MPIYQTTAEAIQKIIIPLDLEEKYTGGISIKRDLIKRRKEEWGELFHPTAEIISPSIEYPKETLEEGGEILILPERLTNPHYGSAELEQYLREMAKKAPGIKKIWEMTKDLPSLTQILLKEREEND